MPPLRSDAEARDFVETADLSEYDLSSFKPMRFEIEAKMASLNIRPFRSPEDHKAALARIEALWSADPDTPEGTELDVLVDLVEHYENRLYPIAPSDPIEIEVCD